MQVWQTNSCAEVRHACDTDEARSHGLCPDWYAEQPWFISDLKCYKWMNELDLKIIYFDQDLERLLLSLFQYWVRSTMVDLHLQDKPLLYVAHCYHLLSSDYSSISYVVIFRAWGAGLIATTLLHLSWHPPESWLNRSLTRPKRYLPTIVMFSFSGVLVWLFSTLFSVCLSFSCQTVCRVRRSWRRRANKRVEQGMPFVGCHSWEIGRHDGERKNSHG